MLGLPQAVRNASGRGWWVVGGRETYCSLPAVPKVSQEANTKTIWGRRSGVILISRLHLECVLVVCFGSPWKAPG